MSLIQNTHCLSSILVYQFPSMRMYQGVPKQFLHKISIRHLKLTDIYATTDLCVCTATFQFSVRTHTSSE